MTQQSQGRLQVIVLDHAPETVWQGIAGVQRTEDWRDRRKLVPSEWISKLAELPVGKGHRCKVGVASTRADDAGPYEVALWYSVREPVQMKSGHQTGISRVPDSQARHGVHFGVYFSSKPGRFGGFPRLWRLVWFPLNGWESAK